MATKINSFIDEDLEIKEEEYKCEICGEVFCGDFDELEEFLWGHIQMQHEEIFEDLQNLDTPYMIEEVYEVNTLKSSLDVKIREASKDRTETKAGKVDMQINR